MSNPTVPTGEAVVITRPMETDLPRHVAILYSVVESWDRGLEYEHIADEETARIAQAILDALTPLLGSVTVHPIHVLEDVTRRLAACDPGDTVVFNLVEALGPTSGPEAEVPRLLERLGFAYVGNTGECLDLCLDKGRTKDLLSSLRIPTASYQVFACTEGTVHVPFPAIVKALAEDCSLGLTADSVVADEESLRMQVQRMLGVYKQPALVEQFLSGREFYASVWDAPQANRLPTLLATSQADYSTAAREEMAFDHFQTKWENTFPSMCPAPIDQGTWARIKGIALAAYRATGCRDYARVDLREHEGGIYVLEVNPNPCLAPDSGFARAARYVGYSFADMALHLVHLAWSRA